MNINKQYWIDFECWSVEAKNEEEARQKIIERLNNGEKPRITNIEEN